MTLAYIRNHYGVPAKIGGRVKYTGGKTERLGTIRGATGPYVKICLDGDTHVGPYHPTWELEYLPDTSPEGRG